MSKIDLKTVIKTMGGASALGRMLGVKPTTVANWKIRGKIPMPYFERIAAEARQQEIEVRERAQRELEQLEQVTFESLVKLTCERKSLTARQPLTEIVGD